MDVVQEIHSKLHFTSQHGCEVDIQIEATRIPNIRAFMLGQTKGTFSIMLQIGSKDPQAEFYTFLFHLQLHPFGSYRFANP